MTDYYDDYFFTSNSTSFECPNIPFKCNPTSACARDSTTGLTYCCSDDNPRCWSAPRECATDGSTIDCGSGDESWCCLDKTEVCTRTEDQINICWNQTPSILFNISAELLNETYSSLTSAAPSATTFVFSPLDLIAQTASASATFTAVASGSPTTTASSSTTAASSSTPAALSSTPTAALSSTTAASSSSPSSTNNTSGSSSSHISGGAIAGIVIGCLAVVALVVAAAFYFLRRRKQPETPPVSDTSIAPPKQDSYYAPPYSVTPSELQGQNLTPELQAQNDHLHELPGNA